MSGRKFVQRGAFTCGVYKVPGHLRKTEVYTSAVRLVIFISLLAQQPRHGNATRGVRAG